MEKDALIFESPVWFAALVLLPLVAALLVWAQWRSDKLLGKVIPQRLRTQLAGAVSRPLRLVRAALILAVLAAIIIALARPQKGYTEQEIVQRGRDIILAVDTSRSMLATDVTPTRLARAKLFAKDLLRLAQGDRIGVVAFAGSAFLQAPLTLDRTAALATIDALDTSIIPKGGTNIAEAIRVAVRAFGKGEGHSRALVIVTDGEELEANGIAEARQASSEGIRIFTVGVGSTEGSLIPIRTEDGHQDFVRDLAGKPVQSRLDAARLREIAEAGGGFFEVLSANTAATLFEKGILPLQMAERGSMASRQPIERYQWPLGAGILFLVLWLILGERKLGIRRLRAASLILFVLVVPTSGWAADGVEAYEQGDYARALQDFQSRLKGSPQSSKLQFNAGAAAFKAGDYPAAVDWFSKALAGDQGDKDATFRNSASYNLANALTRRGEASQKNDEKKADWKSAISHYESVLKDQPNNTNAKENLEIVKKLLEELEKQEKQQNKDQQNKDQQNKDQQDKDQQGKDQQDKDQQDKDQQNKDQQNKDQQNKDQQNKDQQGKDQQGKDQQNKDQQNKDQQDKDQQGKDQQNKDQQNKDQQNKDQQNKDQQNKDQQNKDQQGKDQQNKDQQDKDQQGKDQQGKDQQQAPSNPRDRQPPKEMPEPTPGEKKDGEIKSLNESGKDEQAIAAEPAEKDGEMSEAQARALLNSLRGDEERVRLMRPAQEQTLKDW